MCQFALQIFDVVLNGKHTIVSNLDIYNTVGFATAHDEIVSFQVTNGGRKLTWNQESSPISNKQLIIEFRKVWLSAYFTPFHNMSCCAWKLQSHAVTRVQRTIPRWMRFTWSRALLKVRFNSPSYNRNRTAYKLCPYSRFTSPTFVREQWPNYSREIHFIIRTRHWLGRRHRRREFSSHRRNLILVVTFSKTQS